MKKILSIILALILALAFLAACSGTPAEELTDILSKQAAIESGTASGAIRVTLSNEMVESELAGITVVKPKTDDVVLESLFKAEIDEANQKTKITLFNQDESRVADVFVDAEKFHVEMENLFKLFREKTGGLLPFSKADMGQKKFLNIPHTGWQPHLPTLYNALKTAVSEDENIVQENKDYYSLTLTAPAFASSLTSPFKEWMESGYELVYVVTKKDNSQALTLTIPGRIKIEMKWSMTAGKVDVAVPEGVLLSTIMKPTGLKDEPAKESGTENEKEELGKPESPVEESGEAGEQAPVEEAGEADAPNPASDPEPAGEADSAEEKQESSIKSILGSVIQDVSEDRKLMTAGIFNENANLSAIMDSTAKWLSPLQECYRQPDGNYIYLGLTSLPHENCLPSERDAVNINFYRMGVDRKLEIFIEYDEPKAIKQQLDTFVDVCKKCGYTVDKDKLVQVIDIMQRDAKLLVKGTENDYYMEAIKTGNVNLSAYAAFAGDHYIYMITLDESRS